MAKHHNPNESRRAQKTEPLLGDFFEVFLAQRLKRKTGLALSAKTKLDYRNTFDRELARWKDKPLSAFTQDDAERLYRDYSRTHPTAANRLAALISSIYGFALERKEYRGTNPAAHIKKNGETSRARVLEKGEVKRFWAALQAEENDVARDLFIVALLTGARRSNVLEMAWQDVDLATKEWRIPHTKTGGGLTVPLVPHLVTLLKKRKRAAVNGYVFPGEGKAGHFAEPRKAWARILKHAGLEDVRIHDLRRTLGTAMASTGANMATSMRMLGHSTTHAALIYQRLTVDPVRAAAGLAAQSILDAAGVRKPRKRPAKSATATKGG